MGVDNTRKALIAVAAALVLGGCLWLMWRADNAGWLPHTRDTAMYLGASNWRPGTYRDCAALPKEDGSIFFLGCVEGVEDYMNPQTLAITYWGKVKRPDRYTALTADLSTWKWRCRRKRGGVTCWAVN